MTAQHGFAGFASKNSLLVGAVQSRSVLHLGAVGETLSPTQLKARNISSSVHAVLTEASADCVGVDYDATAVELITQSGLFTNIIAADVYQLDRGQIALSHIDLVVAGDIIEHLGNPGLALERLRAITEPATELVITVPNALGIGLFLRYLRGRAVDGADHRLSFNKYTLTNLLVQAGWEPYEFFGCYQQLAQLRAGLAFKLGSRFLAAAPQFAGTIFVRARKANG